MPRLSLLAFLCVASLRAKTSYTPLKSLSPDSAHSEDGNTSSGGRSLTSDVEWSSNRGGSAPVRLFLPAPSEHELPSSEPSSASNHHQHPSESNPFVYEFVAALFQALRTTPTPQAMQLQRLPFVVDANSCVAGRATTSITIPHRNSLSLSATHEGCRSK
ncbi:hypothetical protein BDD12DRAFT_810154 [Trichophaea hybrida]|nr:hypothetical protein BDD12DRAFT_810154 [Trichophaea hybrida]